LAAARPAFQAKLVVGPVDDPLEREADAVADQVMQTPDPASVDLGAPPTLTRKCAACEAEERQSLHRAAEGPVGVGPSDAPPSVHDVLKSPGHGLDAQTLDFMASRLGEDFDDVRVHTDAEAARSAHDVGARAYTVGHHVVFGRGEYQPQAPSGRRLLAHELAHVVQQAPAAVRRQPVSPPANPPAAAPASTASMLKACDAKQLPAFTAAVSAASKMAADAVQGLKGALADWGKEPKSVQAMATSNALAKGFNIAFDKTIWVSVLGMDPAKVSAQDARDKAATATILSNFQQIQSDVPHYANPPACTPHMTSGATCLGCVDGAHGSCQSSAGDVLAWIPHPFLGQPSSPMMLCPAYFGQSPEEQAGVFLHELAHLQNFAASDSSGATRYYGCPVRPLDPNGPALTDPNDIIGIADAYRCFVVTQAGATAAFTKLGAGSPSGAAVPGPAPASPHAP
jgi:hypothetical protein